MSLVSYKDEDIKQSKEKNEEIYLAEVRAFTQNKIKESFQKKIQKVKQQKEALKT